MTEYNSKHATVRRAPYELYMAFVDMRNFINYLPADKQGDVQADYDSILVNVQNFQIGAKVLERQPYSRISFVDYGQSPFAFRVDVCFDAAGDASSTDFHIDVQADLNFMMRTMLGKKIQEAIDRMVDGLASLSEGRMPEGIDPSMFHGMSDYFHGGTK